MWTVHDVGNRQMFFLHCDPMEASEPKTGERPTEHWNIRKGYSYNHSVIFIN